MARIDTSLPIIALVAVPVLASGCARFGITDAAEAIAFTRDCEPIEITLVEDHRAAYQASGCGPPLRYRCADRRCDALRTPATVPPSVVATHARLGSLREEVLECVGGAEITVQFLISGPQHEPSRIRTSPELAPTGLRCVTEQIRRAVWLADFIDEPRPILLSHTFGARDAQPTTTQSF